MHLRRIIQNAKCQYNKNTVHIGVDLAGILRGTHAGRRRWVSAELGGGMVRVSPLQPTRGSGERRELPHAAGFGAEPLPKTDFGVF